jgi:hypothetical protein
MLSLKSNGGNMKKDTSQIVAVIVILVLSLMILALIFFAGEDSETRSFKRMSIEEKIVFLSNNDTPYKAYIDSNFLVVEDENNGKTTYELPDSMFYVSVAPYINNTHP